MERSNGRPQRSRERDTEMQPVVGIPLAMGPGAGTGLVAPIPVVAAVVRDDRYEGGDEFSSPPPIRVWNASDNRGAASQSPSPNGTNAGRARSESVGTADSRQGSAEGAHSPQIRIGIDEVQNLARHFHCTQEQVLSVIYRAKGDRTLVLELLTAREIPPQSQAVRDASRVQIQKRVIQVTRMEVERLSEMFNVPEARVIAVLKQVKGDRDGALAILSNESNMGAAAAGGGGGTGNKGAPVKVAADTRSRQELDRQADEIRSYAEMFGIPQVEVARVWEDVKGNTEQLLSILERLAHGTGGGDDDPHHGSVVRRPNANPAVGRSAPDVDVIFDDFPVPPNHPARQLPNAPGRNERGQTVSPQGTVMLPELPTDKDL